MNDEQLAAWKEWKKNPTKENMGKVLKSLKKLMSYEVSRYNGTLRPSLLMAHAKKYVTDAIKKYNPNQGVQLGTYVVHNLQRLHRVNYKGVQGLKASEEVQRSINPYLRTVGLLSDKLSRKPTESEIIKEMDIPMTLLKRIQGQMKVEVPTVVDPSTIAHYDMTPEEDALHMIYFDAPPIHKQIIKWRTGIHGSDVLPAKEIGRRLKLSPVRVSQISQAIGNKLRKHVGQL